MRGGNVHITSVDTSFRLARSAVRRAPCTTHFFPPALLLRASDRSANKAEEGSESRVVGQLGC